MVGFVTRLEEAENCVWVVVVLVSGVPWPWDAKLVVLRVWMAGSSSGVTIALGHLVDQIRVGKISEHVRNGCFCFG